MLIDTRGGSEEVVSPGNDEAAVAANGGEVETGLSPLQAGMLYHSLSGDDDGVYLQQLLIHWRAPLDLGALGRAWEIVQARHDILRSAFRLTAEREPRQVLRPYVELPTRTLDWTGLPSEEKEAKLHDLLAADRARGMDLEVAPLQRWVNIRLGAKNIICSGPLTTRFSMGEAVNYCFKSCSRCTIDFAQGSSRR